MQQRKMERSIIENVTKNVLIENDQISTKYSYK